MKDQLNEIRNVEDKYGLMIFRMGLTHLIDVGIRNLSDEDVVATHINQILAQGKEDRDNDLTPFLSPEIQSEILGCASVLAMFTPWALIAYIKAHVVA